MTPFPTLGILHTHPWPAIVRSNFDVIYQELTRLNDGEHKFDEQTLRQIASDVAAFACAETTTDFPEKIAALFTKLQELAIEEEGPNPKALSIKVCEAIGVRFLTERSHDLLTPSCSVYKFTDAIQLPEKFTFTANRSVRQSIAVGLNMFIKGNFELKELQQYFDEGHFRTLLLTEAIRVDFTSAQSFVLANSGRKIPHKKISSVAIQNETNDGTIVTVMEKCDTVRQATFIGNPNQSGPIAADFSLPRPLKGVYSLTVILRVAKGNFKVTHLRKQDVIECTSITGEFSIEDSSRRQVTLDGKTYYLDWDNLGK